jgi:hypothetical protein
VSKQFKAAERHTYEVMTPEDPRWKTIFDAAPHILTRYHGPLPPGPVLKLQVMFITRKSTADGYEETVYFANPDDIARWNRFDRWLSRFDDDTQQFYYETLALTNPKWTVSQIIDYVEARERGDQR